jgi:thiol-disulfide isomerase/thioredoxin
MFSAFLRTMLLTVASLVLFVNSPMVLAEEGGAAPEKPKAEEGKTADVQPDAGKPGEAAKDDVAAPGDKPSKKLWAHSLLYCDAPKIDVSKWLSEKPELEGKFILIEFWRTWCGACKRTVPILNGFHEKYGKELAIIAITGEPEETIKGYAGPEMKYFSAIDAPGIKPEGDDKIKDQGALEETFGVWGWPHVVLLEPEHHTVIWEGFPLQKGYELTAEKIEKALAIGRAQKKEEK